MSTFFRPLVVLFLLLTLLTGGVYPLAVTALAQTFFYSQANGSLLIQGNSVVGSALIGQSFDDPRYFWGRLSATTPVPYNGAASSGSNLGPLNPALAEKVKMRIAALHKADPEQRAPISVDLVPVDLVPVDLVTASASGLDPQISPAAADYQVHRIATARGLNEEVVRQLIAEHTSQRTFGLLGEPRVNVLELNLALDKSK